MIGALKMVFQQVLHVGPLIKNKVPANLKLVNGIQKSKDRSTEEFF